MEGYTELKNFLIMSTQTTYADAFVNLDKLCEQVVADRDVVIITREGAESVALIAADELASLMETAHLLRSPQNAARLLTALQRAKSNNLEPQTVDALRQELRVGGEDSKIIPSGIVAPVQFTSFSSVASRIAPVKLALLKSAALKLTPTNLAPTN